MNRSTIKVLFLILLFSRSLYADGRLLYLDGLKIFTADELVLAAGIGKPGKNIITSDVVKAIDDFYKKNHYSLVKIHILKDTKEELSLFVDEGKLGKIVVHEKNNYYALKIKQAIVIPRRIYNTEVVNNNIEELKEKFGFSEIRVELERIPSYDENLFQIDRELNSVEMLDQKIQIFSKYPAEYELHFYISSKDIEKSFSLEKDGYGFNIDYDYPSVFIPEFSIYRYGIISKKDYLETELSAGFDPGLKGYLKIPPRNTFEFPPERDFFKVDSEYRLIQTEGSIFSPVVRGRLYRSYSGRSDLGLNRYEYIKIRETLAPGITPLDNLHLYAGIGCEHVDILDVSVDTEADEHADIPEGWNNYPFTELRLNFDPIPFRIGGRKERNFTLIYTHYFNGKEFSEFELTGARDYEFSNLSILSLKMRGGIINKDAPFHHQVQVNSQFFKGFSGLSYYSDKLIAFSTEYRFSIYQDYIYTGVFCDWTCFDPVGFVLSGTKNGLVAGPTARFLVYDQFEFTIYYGWDVLFPDGSSQSNLKLKLTRRF